MKFLFEQSKSKRNTQARVAVKILLIGFLCFMALCFTGGFVFLLFINKDLPSIESLQIYEPKELSLVLSRHDETIGEFASERRLVVENIPDIIKHAFIAAEDANFYSHQGLDFLGILRAAYINLKSGSRRQGASTITQQVARAFLLSPEKTYTRKIKEAILAWKIEQKLNKDQILHLYLNHIYLGHGAYGVAAAAETYFGKKIHEVNLAEAAILGGLPQAPSRYSPAKNPDRVKRRQLYVLRQMKHDGFIDEQQYEEAANQEVWIEPRRDLNKTIAPYFVEYVRQYVMQKYGSRMVLEDGLRIHTTLDVDMNRYARNALRKGLSDLEKRQGYRGPVKHLKPDEVEKYFEGRQFEERDEAGVVANTNLEVEVTETEGRGQIRMRPLPPLEVGDFLEGIVIRVNDNEAIVEYEPGYFAQIPLDEMKWAHERANIDDEDQYIQPVRKASDVLKVGDVVVLSVKSLEPTPSPTKTEADSKDGGQEKMGIVASLEQDTEVEGAMLAVDPRSGYILSMVGGYDFNRSEFNRAVQARRQPGSSFKPIIYAAALDLGFTPASILQDSPITFENDLDQQKWRPNNYDQKFVGDTTLRNSLLQSRNITTIKLLNEIGIDTAVNYARRLGIDSELNRDFTLALGSSVVTLDEIVKPYVVFANEGYPKPQLFIRKIVDRDGNVLEDNANENFTGSLEDEINQSISDLKKEVASVAFAPKEEKSDADEAVSFLKDAPSSRKNIKKESPFELKAGQVLSSETSFLITHLLAENILYGSGRRARVLNRPASGKTGTTDENRDAWFLGFTPQLVAGVWVGYDDLRRLGRYETGSRAAVPIWKDFMLGALEAYPKEDFEVPENIEFARIDPDTGCLANSKTKSAVFEAFVKGTVPKECSKQSGSSEVDLYQRDY